ncbi:universal stress protein [Alcanivorax marinus]|uniref:Universal stress protein n=1 Tax=Alloalcanivorax marinus TaxID=1177169 RepID=A0A9Q3UML9_9GAMM|nr:universal stress protein [Alloalcanivorax marinus]MCC4310071.1 universal stress protein [Alloalcanivorax marinus]
MSHVIACIDGSAAAETLCDHAAWAARRLDAPLMLLHVLDEERYPSEPNLSGSIGLGTREALLKELADLDARRNRLALEQGRALLDAASERLVAAGHPAPVLRQRHGKLLDAVRELGDQTRLLVIGKQGTGHTGVQQIGDNVEKLIRGVERPVLMAVGPFREPAALMIAYDNSPSMREGVRLLASSPLLRGLACHLVQVNGAGADRDDLRRAAERLENSGHPVTVATLDGDVEAELHRYQEVHGLDLVVMGAYGHSRIREFLIGSTTDRLIRHAGVPHLILR